MHVIFFVKIKTTKEHLRVEIVFEIFNIFTSIWPEIRL